MYTNDSEISGNVSIGNDIAYAIMYSHRLVVKDNVARGSVEQGLMFNYANHSVITGNSVDGGGKCVFIYNANHNTFQENHFANCDIGVHFTAGSDGNRISRNAFLHNRNQVKYVGTRTLDWSVDGQGNYWSDNTAFDLDGDGIADTAYRPNDVVDQLLWRAPSARILLNSPAVSVVRWAQSQPRDPAGRRGGQRAADETARRKQPGAAMTSLVALAGVGKRYGAHHAPAGPGPGPAARRMRGAGRPQRRRQEHADQADPGPDPPQRRTRRAVRA